MYRLNYEVIRNITLKQDIQIPEKKEKYILYQGAVNEGRSFETIIPAIKFVNAQLIVCGGGNFIEKTKNLVSENKLNDKKILKGYLPPAGIQKYTLNEWAG